jgi:DNA topoisomerase-1
MTAPLRSAPRHSTADATAVTTHAVMPNGLRHADDTRPGYTRKALKEGFAYFDTEGARIDDADEIARINALAIPPAYVDVWICPDPRGHVQATGRDARGRKQYRYHGLWRDTRDADKFERLAAFGRALPKIRARVTRDLKLPGMPCDKVIAAIVQLLDSTLIRVGSVEYARDNQSYGLTTLRKKHLKIEAGRVRFRFRGKSGIEHDVAIDHARVKRIVLRCAELPGHDLFQYLADDGTRHTVGSADINDYLKRVSNADFTAKDYRTWAGSVYAFAALRKLLCESATEARRQIVATVKDVAALLRNTPAVCRRCYIHPAVIAAFEADELQGLADCRPRRGLRVDEAAFASLLASTAKQAARQAANDARRRRQAARPARASSSSNAARARGATAAAEVANVVDAVTDEKLTALLSKSRSIRKSSGTPGAARATRVRASARTAPR